MPDVVVRGVTAEQRDELKARAKLEHRSMNGLLLLLVEMYLARPAQIDNPFVAAEGRGPEVTLPPRRDQVTPRFKTKPAKK